MLRSPLRTVRPARHPRSAPGAQLLAAAEIPEAQVRPGRLEVDDADGDAAIISAEYDVVVIGSGFGGRVSALRLAEKRYPVTVIEAGRWFDYPASDDPAQRHSALPKSSWDPRASRLAPTACPARSRPNQGAESALAISPCCS